MKKIIAVLLCLVCMISSLGMTSFAFTDVFTNIATNMGLEPDEPIIYGIVYDSYKLSGVSIMYKPSPTFTFSKPGTYTVTDDIPLSVDYEFVCWEDEETGKYYHAGDKIYIDGQKVLLAVWQPKTDNHIRPVRVLLTAIETLRRTLKAFFGFYDLIYQEDPEADIPKGTSFKLDGLVGEKHNYTENKRKFTIGVKPCADGVVYESFSITEQIYFGGKFENVEEEVIIRDEDGKITDIKTVVKNKYTGGTEYSALYESTGEMYTDENTGEVYQIINVTLTDGVPDPKTGEYIVFVLSEGMVSYFNEASEKCGNDPYAFVVLSTTNT